MDFKKALELYNEKKRLMRAYGHMMGVMSYDSETAAPKNSVNGRADTYAVMSEITYKLRVNEESEKVLEVLYENKESLDKITRKEVELARESIEKMKKIPMEEIVAFSKISAEAQNAWVEAKNNSDYSIFEPYLEKIVAFNRRTASLVAPEKDPYDYLLDNFEKGLTSEQLDNFFSKIRSALVPLIHRIIEKGDVIRTDFMSRNCPIEKQREFSDYLMQVLKINRDDCTIGETEHPFTTNFNKHDVRITTHYHEDLLVSNMYSVIHEGGHALYELNTGDDLYGSELDNGTSMGIHEAQSRFYENIIGRSEAFVSLIFPKVKKLFPEQFKDVSEREFYLAVNKAEPSLIRTEADELTYSLHIMVRYELEKKMIRGEIAVKDIPSEWNRLYKEYLGVDVPDDKHGVLQDMHWSGGMLGYFPSYALGSAYGAQIVESMKKDLDIEKLVRENRIDRITEWLTERIYKYGKLIDPAEAIQNACGAEFDPDFYINYLTEKYSKIYGL
ncbi:MAG: carboxypeptidase M32 [Clostridia bacterium]|nr:carboxypeptidase M32 [Clostridia bacterium]